jgi:hypothetical protein
MKHTILTLLLVFFAGCSNDNIKRDPIFQLPPETQTGANTFGVTIKGKVYIPRDPTGVNVGPSGHGMVFRGVSDLSWNELEVIDGASSVGFQMYIHIQNFQSIGIGQYNLKQSNFHNQIDSTPFSHIYFKIWDSTISNYAYYGSIENEGVLNITRSSNDIYSGNFKGNFVRYDNPNDFIEITDGRFDIGPGLHTKVFP